MKDVIDMQIIKTYPPEVQTIRDYCFDLMKLAENEMLKEAGILRHLQQEDQASERRRIQKRYMARCAPFTAELARLEICAQVSVILKGAPEGEVVAR